MSTDFVGSGWAFPVTVDATGRIALASGATDIEQAIQLILRTYPGERPMREEFGSRLRDFVFDGATPDNIARIVAEVRLALGRWEPRIAVAEVTVIADPDVDGLLYIEIRYTIRTTNSERNLVFPFYTIPAHEE
jgi:phage baseplate assembly protein W